MYSQLPLQKTSDIRLLQLSAINHVDDPISGNLVVVSLDEQPSYAALSYTWGEPIFDKTISISSLDGALRHVLQKLGPWLIFVVQICINQADTDERSKQVSLMRCIYNEAQQTFVWLGHAGPYTAEGIALANGSLSSMNRNEDIRTSICGVVTVTMMV